jgi:hypothetical protein
MKTSKPSTKLRRLAHAKLMELLCELANLHDDGAERFRRLWSIFPREPDANLLALRNDLRRMWNRNEPEAAKNAILERWITWRPGGFDALAYNPWEVKVGHGLLLPRPNNLRITLVMAVLGFGQKPPRLAKCNNPECVVPYFIGTRRDSKYCERGECVRYAQREYSMKSYYRTRGLEHSLRTEPPDGAKTTQES